MDSNEKDRSQNDDAEQTGAGSPEQPAPDAPTARIDEPMTAAPAPPAAADASPSAPAAVAESTDDERKRRRTRNLLIGAGAVVALLAVGGGAYAIGNAVADDDDDRPGMHDQSGPGGDPRGGDPRDDDRDDRGDRGDDSDDNSGMPTASAETPDASAASLRTAAEAAIAHVDGEGITDIEVERGGYDIDVRLSDGTEADLFVTADGTVTKRQDDDDDDPADPVIDLGQLADILSAAQSAATAQVDATWTLVSLSTQSGGTVAYDVELRQADGRDADVDLATDLSVVQVDIDD